MAKNKFATLSPTMNRGNATREKAYANLANFFAQQQAARNLPISQYVQSNYGPSAGPSTGNIAQYVIEHAKTNNELSAEVKAERDAEPSLMSRIFDFLSRPNYAVANFADEIFNDNDPNSSALAEAWEGFTGRDKTTFSDVLEHGGMKSDTGRGILGFGLDVITDPINLIPGAAIAKGVQKGRAAVGLGGKGKEVLQQPLAQRMLSQGEPINPEVFGLSPKASTAKFPIAFKGSKFAQKPSLVSKLSTPTPRVSLPAQGVPATQLELPFDWPDALRMAEQTKQVPKASAKAEKVIQSQIKGQKAIPFGTLKKGIWHSRRGPASIAKVREISANNAGKLINDAIAGSTDALIKLTPKALPDISQQERALQKVADDIFKWRSPKLHSQDTIDNATQAKIWSQAKQAATGIVSRSKKSKAGREVAITERALKIYGAAEKQFLDAGYKFSHNNSAIRLSNVLGDLSARNVPITDDVIREFAGKAKPGGEVWKSLEVLRARNALHEAPIVKQIADKAVKSSHTVRGGRMGSFPQMNDLDNLLKKISTQAAKKEGLSKASIKSVEGLVKLGIQSGKSAGQIVIERNAKILDEIVASGKQNLAVNKAKFRALEADLGEIPKWAITANKATESIMGNMATAWGQKDLRPLTLVAIGAAHHTAQARGRALAELFRPYDANQAQNAWLAAQQGIDAGEDVADLTGHIKALMDNMVSKVSGQSVVFRSGVNMDELNKWMTRMGTKVQFSKGKVKNALTGETIDLSKGSDWVDSWKTWDIGDDPMKFLFRMQEAMEMATRHKAVFDDMGERFGSHFYGKGFTEKITGHPYLDGYYFPSDIAKQIPRFVRDWSIPTWTAKNPLLQHYDRVLSMWKSGVTIYRPGHHLRNMAGDIYLAYMDGVRSVKPYRLALQVLKAQHGQYKGLKDIDRLVEIGLMPKGMGIPTAGKAIFRNKSGKKFTAEQIWAVATQKGLIESTHTIEDIIDLGLENAENAGKFEKALNVKPFGGRVQKAARSVSETQQHAARLAHFIDKVMKSKGDNLEDIFEQASRRSRKWHPTSLDLTPFEKKYLRRIMPFYSWTRKAIPLVLEGLVMHPGRTVVPAKLAGGIQEAAGIEQTEGRLDPFPTDQMFPHWLRAEGIGPLGTPQGFLGALSQQEPPGYVMAGQGLNPLASIIADFDVTAPEGPLKTLGGTVGSMLTPAAKIPTELLFTGKKMFTGEPITGQEARPGALEQYVGEQIPIYSIIQNITGITPFGTETKKAQRGGQSIEGLVNTLTGAGIQGTGAYRNQALYEARLPFEMQKKLAREQFYRKLAEKYGAPVQ